MEDLVWPFDGSVILVILLLIGVLFLDDLLQRLLNIWDVLHNRSWIPDSIITGCLGHS